MNLTEWDELPYMERVIIVAVSRIKKSMSNLQAEAELRAERNKGR